MTLPRTAARPEVRIRADRAGRFGAIRRLAQSLSGAISRRFSFALLVAVEVPTQHRRDGDLNGGAMTPMIDVVFLLLVFFVCASIGQAPEVLLPAELSVGSTEVNVPPSR